MHTVIRFFHIYFPKSVIEKLLTFGILGLLAFMLKDFLVLFFITFIFAYIFLELGERIAHKIQNWGAHGKKDTPHHLAAKYGTTNTIVTILYILFVLVLIFVFVNILPKISFEIRDFVRQCSNITRSAQELVWKIENSLDLKIGLDSLVENFMSSGTIEAMGHAAIEQIKNAGIILLKFFLALLLSYIFILERDQIGSFLEKIKKGNFSFFYDEGSIIAKKIGRGFGAVLQAQGSIALVNTVLTMIGLFLIGFILSGQPFPYAVTLGVVVFIFGFIPFFGVFLSGIPIILIAYGMSGWSAIIACIAMILMVHMIEAYYLNPKIVSSYMHLPVFVTFVILLISEHFLGVVGLLIGVPLTNIFLDLIEDFDGYINDVKKRLQHG